MQENQFIAPFAERLAKLRVQKGVSAREMSLDLGQTHSFIHGFENRRSFPQMLNFFYICEYLGITPQEFFDYSNAKPLQGKELYDDFNKLDSASQEYVLRLVKDMANRPK